MCTFQFVEAPEATDGPSRAKDDVDSPSDSFVEAIESTLTEEKGTKTSLFLYSVLI